jgi:hypothetical protein
MEWTKILIHKSNSDRLIEFSNNINNYYYFLIKMSVYLSIKIWILIKNHVWIFIYNENQIIGNNYNICLLNH